MKFIFHSVVDTSGQTKYYNIYKIEEDHYFAECHHFNRKQSCEGDFELYKRGDDWAPAESSYEDEAQRIGEEIDRIDRDRKSS